MANSAIIRSNLEYAKIFDALVG